MALPTHVGAWSMAVLLGQPFVHYSSPGYMQGILCGGVAVDSCVVCGPYHDCPHRASV